MGLLQRITSLLYSMVVLYKVISIRAMQTSIRTVVTLGMLVAAAYYPFRQVTYLMSEPDAHQVAALALLFAI